MPRRPRPQPSTRLCVLAHRVELLELFLVDAGRPDLALAADNIARELRKLEERPQLRRVA